MFDKDFEFLVLEDAKGNLSVEDQLYLRSPEIAEKWRSYLTMFVDDLSEKIEQLSEAIAEKRKLYEDFTNDPAKPLNEQLQKAMSFKFKFERRLAEAERLLGLKGNYDKDGKLFTFLRDAIVAHKNSKLEPDEYDLKLWEALEGKVN